MSRRAGALSRLVGVDEPEATELLQEAWDKHDEAWHQVETFGPGRMAAYILDKRELDDDADLLENLTREFEEASLIAGVDRTRGSLETIKTLEENDIKIGLICDTGLTPGRVVRDLLDSVGLLEHLEVQCFSDEVGVPKPGHEIFDKAIAEFGVRPPEAIHVGDLKRTDIAGAQDMGMHPVRYRGIHDDKSETLFPHMVIDRHEQLLEIIGLT